MVRAYRTEISIAAAHFHVITLNYFVQLLDRSAYKCQLTILSRYVGAAAPIAVKLIWPIEVRRLAPDNELSVGSLALEAVSA